MATAYRGFQLGLLPEPKVNKKAVATAYGGTGIEHLFIRVAPTLRSRYGIGQDAIDQMLVHNPRRLLDRPDSDRCD